MVMFKTSSSLSGSIDVHLGMKPLSHPVYLKLKQIITHSMLLLLYTKKQRRF